jgi:2-polyprenyl-3-methyl-5-hydroxy-6-metoxy-1,4-benzoquinol methylase
MAKTLKWTHELVEKFWTGVSQTRLSELSFSKHNAEYLIELIADHLKPQGRHLDFGAGEGDLVRALLEKGYAAAAYEPVNARSALFPADIATHPKYLGAANSTGSERFDVVLMIEVIEHVLEEYLPGVLQKVKSSLVDGGTLIVTTPNAEDLDLAAAYCPQCETLFHRWQHQRSFTPESLPKFLGRHGFECLDISEVDFSYTRFFIEDLKYLNEEIETMRRREQRSLFARLRRFLTGQRIAERAHPPRYLRADPATLLYIGRKIQGESS